MSAKYACITRYRPEYAVRLMCGVLDVSAAGYYASLRRRASRRAGANEQLLVEIRTTHRQSRRRYGAPRIHRELKATGQRVGHNRVARLMRADGLQGRRPRRFVVTTQSDPNASVPANHVAQEFGPGTIGGADRVWASDITYLPTQGGWLYLAVVLDLGTRRVVGWQTGHTLGEELVLAALRHALQQRRPAPGWWHHSDRGSQYTGRAYRALVEAHGGQLSMSRTGNCYDNAVVESFFATLKVELGPVVWADALAARRDLFEFIEVWYNRQRRHSTLGYLSPAAYERQLVRRARAA